jgi:hypothetical protein
VTDLVTPGTSQAYANHGRWVARCGHDCGGAAELDPFAGGFICGSCHKATEVIWPSPSMVEGVQRLLLMRPNRRNQNWVPGEALTDLMWENGQHGVFDRYTSDATVPLSVTDDAIRTDLLPVLNPRSELRAVGR